MEAMAYTCGSAKPTHRGRLMGSPSDLVWWLLAGFLLCPSPSGLRADIFHLADGSSIDGLLVEELPEHLRIKTVDGYVLVNRSEVLQREPAPTPWPEYEAKLAATPDDPQSQFDLARWCDQQGLSAERDDHLRRAIRLDMNFEPAYRELGLARVGPMWLNASIRPTSQPDGTPDDADEDAEQLLQQEDRLVREVINGWFFRVRAVKSAYLLEPTTAYRDRLFRQGTERILRIRDPLAIPAIAGVLSKGNIPTRILMVDALASFDQDDATLNLLITALFDPDQEVREAAAQALAPRKDERLVDRLRDGLRSEYDHVVRNAAFVLGRIRAREAVPDLVNVLTTAKQVTEYVPLHGWIVNTRNVICSPTRAHIGDTPLSYHPRIAVFGQGSRITTAWTTQRRVVTVYRTEVQEALIEITGENFGFDADAWLRWHQTHP
jgi:hypothetical protein